MEWIGIGMVVFILFLLVSGRKSEQKTIEFYRRFYTREQLDDLADNYDSDLARKALGRDKM